MDCNKLVAALQGLAISDASWERAIELLLECKKQQRHLYIIGNGTSAAIAEHFQSNMIKNAHLHTTTFLAPALITALGNDCGFDQVFSHPLQYLFRPKDLLIAISSSGRSKNICDAVQLAKEKKGAVITLSGGLAGQLKEMGAVNFWVPTNETPVIESAHFFILRSLTEEFIKKGCSLC